MQQIISLVPSILKARNRQPILPRFLTYIVSFSCNARCIMCDSWKKPHENDLTLDEIHSIFAQLPQMDFVRLSGGEPFVRKDLLAIAHAVQNQLKPFVLHITTNGMLPKRVIEFCKARDKSVPLYLLVSLDGLEDKHNYVRGSDLAWRTAIQTVEALAPRQKELRLNLGVNQTIVDAEGVAHYQKLRDYLRPLGVQNNMVMAYDASATYHTEAEQNVAPTEIGEFFTFGDFTNEQLETLLNAVEADIKTYPIANRAAKQYYLKGIRNRLLSATGEPNPPCVALNAHLRIFPDGSVPTCQFNSQTVGNLREQSFEEIWWGDDIQQQRNWVNGCPGCWAECEVLPNALYTGDLLTKTVFGIS